MTTKWVVFDAEADGLKPTKVYCICCRDYLGNRWAITNTDGMREFFKQYDIYIGHNIRRFDIPMIVEGLLGVDTKEINFVDTLGVSWYLWPERKKHSLESFGQDYDIPKVQIDDWFNLTIEQYVERCSRDVDINYALWLDCFDYLVDLYGKNIRPILRYLDFKLYCAHLAEKSRWKVDVSFLKENIEKLERIKQEKYEELRAALPKIPIVKSYERPKRFRNADGQLSVLGQRWQDRVREAGLPDDYAGTLEVVVGEVEGNPDSPAQIKDWLDSLGWKPQTFKTTRNKKTGEDKSVPQVNSKPGTLCESVLDLIEVNPSVKALEGYSVVNHRLGLLRGFLRDMSEDGYLTASVAGLTNTLRFKHTEIVNLPKIGTLYSEGVRGSLVARDGMVLCGADMSSLEDRLKQHFIFPYDPDYVNELNKPDYDPHLDLALLAGALTAEQVQGYKDDVKEIVHVVKPIRSIYKNGNYACQYGAGVSRLAITCGCDRDTARRVHETYWKRNWAIRAVSNDSVYKTVNGQMWLYNPISRFWYSLRNEKDIFSTLVQGSAVYCFDFWVRQILDQRPQLTGQFHDEIIVEIPEGKQNECRAFLEQTIERVNDILKLNRRLDIGIQFGHRYSEIH